MSKRLKKSVTDKKIAGVCAGLAEYFDMDPTIMRIIFLVGFFVGVGSPGLIYLILMIVLP